MDSSLVIIYNHFMQYICQPLSVVRFTNVIQSINIFSKFLSGSVA